MIWRNDIAALMLLVQDLQGHLGDGSDSKGEGTPRKLTTATQPQIRRIVISLILTSGTEWSSANEGNDNAIATQLEED
jgi:hypothetical protein